MPLTEFVARLAKIPLLYQPGTKFHYSVAVDVLGRVVEVASGETLDVFFEKRIFKPLDMVDTAFYVPASKVDRFAANYGPGLVMIDDPAKSAVSQTSQVPLWWRRPRVDSSRLRPVLPDDAQ